MCVRLCTMSAVTVVCCALLPLEARSQEPSESLANQLAPLTMGPGGNFTTDSGSGSSLVAQLLQSVPSTIAGASIGPSSGNQANPSGVSSNPSQSALPGTGTQGAGSVPAPISGPPRVGLFTETGNALLRDGIDIHGIVLNRYALDSTAGPDPHNQGDITAIAPAADFDLGKLLGIDGGNIHTQVTFLALRVNEPNFSDTTGGFLTGFQATPALPGNWAYISYLTYEQKLLKQKLSIEFGRTNFFRYFFLPNSLDPFLAFSTVAQVVGDSATVPFPTWGARAIYHVTPTFYYQVAAFEDNFFRSTNEPFTLGSSRATGAQVFAEVGSRSEFFNSRYPENFELGVEYSTRTGYSYTKGSPLVAFPAFQAANYPGGGFVFFQGLQTLWRGGRRIGGPPPNIAVYGAADVSYDKPQPFDLDALVGVNFTGLVPRRPNDALGLQAHYQRLSKVEAGFESRFHDIFAGPGPDQSRNNWAFDATYNLSFNNVVSIRPSVQYFVNPDNYGDPTFHKRPADGFEISALLVISLGRLFGTSMKPI